MNNKKLTYYETGFKLDNNLAYWKYLRDENYKEIYREFNMYSEAITFCI